MSSNTSDSSAPADEIVYLVSAEKERIPVEKSVIMAHSMTVQNCFGGAEFNENIPLPKFSSATLKTVVVWCRLHAGIPVPSTDEELSHDRFIRELSPEEAEIFVKLDPNQLADVLKAAHYLDIVTLLNAGCRLAAKQIEAIGSTEGIKQYLNFSNTPPPAEKI